MIPRVGRRNPLITLKSVVLPAPFGPSTPTISPGLQAMSTRSSAVIPPKWIVRSRVRRSVLATDTSARLHDQIGDDEVQRDDPDRHRSPEDGPPADEGE